MIRLVYFKVKLIPLFLLLVSVLLFTGTASATLYIQSGSTVQSGYITDEMGGSFNLINTFTKNGYGTFDTSYRYKTMYYDISCFQLYKNNNPYGTEVCTESTEYLYQNQTFVDRISPNDIFTIQFTSSVNGGAVYYAIIKFNYSALEGISTQNGSTVQVINTTNASWTSATFVDSGVHIHPPADSVGYFNLTVWLKNSNANYHGVVQIKKNGVGYGNTMSSYGAAGVWTKNSSNFFDILNTTDTFSYWVKNDASSVQNSMQNVSIDYNPVVVGIQSPENNSLQTSRVVNIITNASGGINYQVCLDVTCSSPYINATSTTYYSGNINILNGVNYIRSKGYDGGGNETNWSNTTVVRIAHNITVGNTTLFLDPSYLQYQISRNDSNIFQNDYATGTTNTWGSVALGNASGAIIVGNNIINSYSNTSNSMIVDVSTIKGNVLWVANVTNDSVTMNTTVTPIKETIENFTLFEYRFPLLNNTVYGADRYDTVLLNSTMASTDLNMFFPMIPAGGLQTRYATIDQNIIVSKRAGGYFEISFNGNTSAMTMMRQYVNTANTSNSTSFALGFINWSIYPHFTPNLVTTGNSISQNITFNFANDKNKFMLPNGNALVNASRFDNITVYGSQQIADDMRRYEENMFLSNLVSNWYPTNLNDIINNVTLPYIWIAQQGYTSKTYPLGNYMNVQGSYYYANASGKRVLNVWYESPYEITKKFAFNYTILLEAENYTQCPATWTCGSGYVAGYSGGYLDYSNINGSYSELNWTGEEITILYTSGTNKGLMNVSVDGVNYSVDTYSATAVNQVPFKVPSGKLQYDAGTTPTGIIHNTKIYVTGLKNTSSTGYYVAPDAVLIYRNDSLKYEFVQAQMSTGGLNPTIINGCSQPTCQYHLPAYTNSSQRNNITVNVKINGTYYPYTFSLGTNYYFGTYNDIFGGYTIYMTDENVTWLNQHLPRWEEKMLYYDQNFFNSTYGLIKFPIYIGAHTYVDGLYYSGLDGLESSNYMAAASMLGALYNITGNAERRDFWLARSATIASNMVKDINNGGLWYNSTEYDGGYFVLSVENTDWVRQEAEEADFLGNAYWVHQVQTNSSGRNNSIYRTKINTSTDIYYNTTEENKIVLNGSNNTHKIVWNFTGTAIRAGFPSLPNSGKLNASIDGGENVTIDQYSATPIYQNIILINNSLVNKKHNITFYPTGLKNTSSTGYNVTLDFVEVFNFTINAMNPYENVPFTMGGGLLPDWYRNQTIAFVESHEGEYIEGVSGLLTDYMFPWVPEQYNYTSTNFSNPFDGTNATRWTNAGQMKTYGHVWSSVSWNGIYLNGGHFPNSLWYRIMGNYTRTLKHYVDAMTSSTGTVERYNDTGAPDYNAVYGVSLSENQWAPYVGAAFVPFLTNQYVILSDVTPPSSITNPQSTLSNYINWTWTNPTETDFDHVWIKYSNGTLYQNISDPTNSLSILVGYNITLNLSTQTVDTVGNINATLVWLNATTPLEIYTPYSPTSLTYTNGSDWVNHTWQAGAGNITNSYNVSHNGAWTNGSSNTYLNATVGAGNWSNISVYAYNNSGTGALNLTPVSQNVRALPATYIPPTPASCYSTNSTSNIHVYCSAGSGNGTNGMNFSRVSGTWINGTAFNANFEGLSEGTLYNFQIWAYNSTGAGTLSLTYASISNTTQITSPTALYPNHVINISSTKGSTWIRWTYEANNS